MSGDPFWQAITAQGLQVPLAVAALHKGQGARRLTGHCTITRGSGPAVAMALWLAGFPPAGQDVPTSLTIIPQDDTSEWRRDFDGHATVSNLRYDARQGHVIERFGPIRLTLSLRADAVGLHISVAAMRLFGIPVPGFLVPVSTTVETEDGTGRFHFDVRARLPGVGPLIRYCGSFGPASVPGGGHAGKTTDAIQT